MSFRRVYYHITSISIIIKTPTFIKTEFPGYCLSYSREFGFYECGSFDNDANAGNVVVNPSKAHLALKWLQRKRFDVVGLFIVDEQNGHGLGITYRKKN